MHNNDFLKILNLNEKISWYHNEASLKEKKILNKILLSNILLFYIKSYII